MWVAQHIGALSDPDGQIAFTHDTSTGRPKMWLRSNGTWFDIT